MGCGDDGARGLIERSSHNFLGVSMLSLSAEGFPSRTWGPALWHAIHIIAANFPLRPTSQQRRAFLALFASLAGVLPCSVCREEYSALITTGPLRLGPRIVKDRMTAFAWTVAIHNAVNARLGKPVDPDVRAWYEVYDCLRAKRSPTASRPSHPTATRRRSHASNATKV